MQQDQSQTGEKTESEPSEQLVSESEPVVAVVTILAPRNVQIKVIRGTENG